MSLELCEKKSEFQREVDAVHRIAGAQYAHEVFSAGKDLPENGELNAEEAYAYLQAKILLAKIQNGQKK